MLNIIVLCLVGAWFLVALAYGVRISLDLRAARRRCEASLARVCEKCHTVHSGPHCPSYALAE